MPRKSTRSRSPSKSAGLGPAFVEKMLRVPWQEFPGHFGGALSKALVGPGNSGSERIDFRISRYAPNAYVQEHVHKVQEQIYYVLEGNGVLTLDDTPHLMGPHDYVYVPPGVRHSFTNSGLVGLVFLVVTTPADDEPAV
ncbi:MAG TPA: cupin domain-containing protein [Casimicrobiaceae bacterium]|nr:cupin domain-containing protein [Casimicrobiaceae bacterium]